MDDESISLDPRFGCQIRHGFEGPDVLGATIRVAAVVQGIDPDVDVLSPKDFGPCQRIRQKDRISSWHISQRDIIAQLVSRIVFWDVEIMVRQRATSKASQVQVDNHMLCDLCIDCDLSSPIQFDGMALTVSKADCVRDKTSLLADRKARR